MGTKSKGKSGSRNSSGGSGTGVTKKLTSEQFAEEFPAASEIEVTSEDIKELKEAVNQERGNDKELWYTITPYDNSKFDDEYPQLAFIKGKTPAMVNEDGNLLYNLSWKQATALFFEYGG